MRYRVRPTTHGLRSCIDLSAHCDEWSMFSWSAIKLQNSFNCTALLFKPYTMLQRHASVAESKSYMMLCCKTGCKLFIICSLHLQCKGDSRVRILRYYLLYVYTFIFHCTLHTFVASLLEKYP